MLDQELLSLKEYFFRLIRHFFSPNFQNLSAQSILPKLGFKPFNNGLFQKENKQEGVEFEPSNNPSSPEFLVFLSLLETPHPLETLRPKTKTPGNYTFLITSRNSTLSLINPRKFLFQFLQYPLEFHILNPPPPPVCFFWNSPMKECLNSPLSI